MKNKKSRNLLKKLHHILLIIHIMTVVSHSFQTENFKLEFWLTLMVNTLLLIDLEKIVDKVSRHIESKQKWRISSTERFNFHHFELKF